MSPFSKASIDEYAALPLYIDIGSDQLLPSLTLDLKQRFSLEDL